MRLPSVVEWCCPSPCIFLPLGLCIVESSPIKYPVTTGCLGRPRSLGCSWRCRCSSAVTCGCIVWRKYLERAFCHRCGFPGRFGEKPAQSCQARSCADLTQQVAQGSSSFTLHQPQQYGHEVLVLGFGEQVLEPLGKVAHLFIQTYNGDWHWTPPGSQGLFFFSLIPHGVLSCHSPFQKCKHRVRKQLHESLSLQGGHKTSMTHPSVTIQVNPESMPFNPILDGRSGSVCS